MCRPLPAAARLASAGIVVLSALAVLVGATAPARADAGPCAADLGCPPVSLPGRAECARTESSWRFTVEGSASADIEHDRGSVSRRRELLEIALDRRLDARWAIGLDVEVEMDAYRFRRVDAFVPGEGRLLEDAWRVRVRPEIDVELGRGWSLRGGVAVEAAGATRADLGDATTLGGRASVRRRISDGLGIRAGVLVSGTIEDDPFVLPFVIPDGGDDDPNARFHVELRGSSIRAGYALTPRFTAGLRVAYDRRDWRLAADDRVSEGVLRDIRVPIGAFLDVHLTPRWTLGLEAGVVAYQELEVDDRRGERIIRADADPSLYAGLSLTLHL